MFKKLAILVAILVACAAAFVAFKMLQPVPEGLDLATTRTTAAQHFTVSISPENPDFQRNTLHTWIALITAPDGTPVTDASISIDGGMPQHGHGLPTNPQMTENLGEGRYRIEGVRFNMRGWWEFKLAITTPEASDTITFNMVY